MKDGRNNRHSFYFIAAMAFVFLSLPSYAMETLKVGLLKSSYNTRIPQKDVQLGMDIFLQEMSRPRGVKVETFYYDEEYALIEDFKSGKINFASASPLTFIKYAPKSMLDVGTTAYKTTKDEASVFILLGKTNDARPLSQKLAGKIATDGNDVNELYLKTLMLENGLNDTPQLLVMPNANQSILKLFFGQCDLTLTDRGTYSVAIEMNPQLKNSLEILKTISLASGSIAFTHKGISPLLRTEVIGFKDVMNSTARGQQLLKMFRSTTMDLCYPKDLENVEVLYERYETLKKTRHNNKIGVK